MLFCQIFIRLGGQNSSAGAGKLFLQKKMGNNWDIVNIMHVIHSLAIPTVTGAEAIFEQRRVAGSGRQFFTTRGGARWGQGPSLLALTSLN